MVPETPQTAKGQTQAEELSKPRQSAARRVAEAKATIPHIYLTAEADVSLPAEAPRPEHGDPLPTLAEYAVRASGLALREFPRANGAYRDGRLELHSRVNVGLLMEVGDGAIAPTIFDADRKSLEEIAIESRALAVRARNGSITQPELAGGTFTVADLTAHGVDTYAGIVAPGQAALLALGGAAPRIRLTLACDARVLQPPEAAGFLGRISALVGDAEALAS